MSDVRCDSTETGMGVSGAVRGEEKEEEDEVDSETEVMEEETDSETVDSVI